MNRNKTPAHGLSFRHALRLLAACGLFVIGVPGAFAQSYSPVYVHMNGANDFLESVVAVHPGQPVVWVNEDQGKHIVAGYHPADGSSVPGFHKVIDGTPGPGHEVHTYKKSFSKKGIHFYYCSIHAKLEQVFGKRVQPAHRKGIPGYNGAMAGVVIVTNDTALINDDPASTHKKVLPNFFGG